MNLKEWVEYIHARVCRLEEYIDEEKHVRWRILGIEVESKIQPVMASNTQSFDTSQPTRVFTVSKVMSDGTKVPIDPSDPALSLSFSTSSGDPGAFSGDILTVGTGGAGVVSASYESFTATDDVTITEPLTVTDISIEGA